MFVFLLALLSASSAQSAVQLPEDCLRGPGGHVRCQLTSINSKFERTDFSVIPGKGTLGLTVVCTQSSPGRLEPAGFAALNELEELTIEGCALDHLPAGAFSGLPSLRRLKIMPGGENQQDFVLRHDAFRGVENLQSLEVSHSGLSDTAQLCQLSGLKHLNLSGGRLSHVAGLQCLSGLTSLDLSDNLLSSFSWAGLAGSLVDVNLNNNQIVTVGAVVSSGLRSLDLSHNKIQVLPPNFLPAAARLEKLSLAHNYISALPAGLLHNQAQLGLLDLSTNLLTRLDRESFGDLPGLEEVLVGNNQLASFPADLADVLPNLQVLRANNNDIHSIEANNKTMLRLTTLDLSNNKIGVLDNMTACPALTHLLLANNSISSVRSDALDNCTNLLVMDVSFNEFNEFPAEALKGLNGLQTLDISHNKIVELSLDAEVRMEHLWRLQLSDNLIEKVTLGSFDSLNDLQVVDLSNNKISFLEPGTFSGNRQLSAVRLDGNSVQDISGLFSQLPGLVWLNMSDNRVASFDYSMLPHTLTWLDISHNNILDIEDRLKKRGNISLEYLDASFNQLTSLSAHNVPENIETLYFNDNYISSVAPYTFYGLDRLSRVDLSVNKLEQLTPSSLKLDTKLAVLPQLQLGGNPLVCNCHLEWLKSVNSHDGLQPFLVVTDLESLYCSLVHVESQPVLPLVEVDNDQFLCSYTKHCFSLCQCCQFDSCDCEMTCPEGCSCFHDNSWTKNIVQCSASDMSSPPVNIPMDATHVKLDGNQIARLKSHSFIGRKNVRQLYLNNSLVEKIDGFAFKGLKSLRVLHLEDNMLTSLDKSVFHGISHLKELYLNNNMISRIHKEAFKSLRNLAVLHLHNNHLVDFPVWQAALSPGLAMLRLADNLWSCECDYLGQLAGWLSARDLLEHDGSMISCVTNEVAGGYSITELSTECSEDRQTTSVAKYHVLEAAPTFLPLIVAVLASFVLVAILSGLAFAYRHTLRGALASEDKEAAAAGGLEKDADETYVEPTLFDAYVCYSPADELYVSHQMSCELEKRCGYKLCLQGRDLGRRCGRETLSKATRASSRTLIVLSPGFMATEWSKPEVRASLAEPAAKKKIFVLLSDVGRVSDDLLLLMKKNIVVRWEDQFFWRKIKYSLPGNNSVKFVDMYSVTMSV